MYKALMIEDHKEVRDFVKEYFDHKEIEVIEAQNGYEGLAILDDTIDIILLDIMMPGIDGYEVCKQIRSQYNTLIVFISALSEDENQLKAYEYGADDYITKPFSPLELVARVKTQLRRYTRYNTADPREQERNEHDFRGLFICQDSHQCTLNGEDLTLTPIEFNILWYLCEHRGKVVSSEELFEAVWKEKYMDGNNTVMAHIARLREKMKEPSRKPKFIKTVWGVGYTIE